MVGSWSWLIFSRTNCGQVGCSLPWRIRASQEVKLDYALLSCARRYSNVFAMASGVETN